jgi:hypothetical protein
MTRERIKGPDVLPQTEMEKAFIRQDNGANT